jgi:hypothetical protein
MSLFNTYEECQIKVGDLSLKKFKVGDYTEIPDGMYIAHEGIVVIQNGIFIGVVKHIFDKWGNEIEQARVIDIIKSNDPIQLAIDESDGNPKNKR